MKTVGIIGFGSFGRFLAEKLKEYCEVKVYSNSGKPNQWEASLEEIGKCDYIIPAIPLDAYESLLNNLKPLLLHESVIVDIASVKVKPVALIKKILPNQPLVVTHPLFGPESARDSLKGHVLVLCPENSQPEAYADVKKFALSLGLDTVELSEEAHDQEMAVVHGLTFFIARSLKGMKLHDQKLSTPSFEKLLALARLETHHSDDLFRTIQTGNPYTSAVRTAFLDQATQVDDTVS